MKLFIACAFSVFSIAASAQTINPPGTVGNPGMNGPNYSTARPDVNGVNSETPTMRRAKLQRALALREEANALLAQDGGKLTPEHQNYIRRRSCEILGYHVRMGSRAANSDCEG